LTQDQSASTQTAAFPNLASVPDRAPKVMSPEQRAVLQESLVADRSNAVYSGEKLVAAAPSQPALSQPAPSQPVPAPQIRVPAAPPAPKIAGQLGAAPAPVQTQVAQTQPAQTQVAQTQVAQSSSGQTQLRFPQFQNVQPPVAAAPVMATLPAASGAQLVAVVYFAHSSSRIDGNDRGVLRDIVALHRQRGGVIRVVGHASAHTGVTDQIAHNLANFEMSLKRANAVAAALVALGLSQDEVRAEARGDNQPVYHEFMTTGEAGNRRVEIFLEN
jgi:outer membrane protein OmpA-like peptidoglycan-associated protein